MKTTLPFRAMLRVRLLTMSLNRHQFRNLLFKELRLRKTGRKSPVTMFLRSRALRKLNISRLPTDMLKTDMLKTDMLKTVMHRICKRKMVMRRIVMHRMCKHNSHLTHISREPICSTAQCTATAMFPTAHMRQIRDSRVMRRRSSSIRSMPSMRSMHSRADMQLIPHRAGEFLPCRIYLRKR